MSEAGLRAADWPDPVGIRLADVDEPCLPVSAVLASLTVIALRAPLDTADRR
jgi:hypothetical protein